MADFWGKPRILTSRLTRALFCVALLFAVFFTSNSYAACNPDFFTITLNDDGGSGGSGQIYAECTDGADCEYYNFYLDCEGTQLMTTSGSNPVNIPTKSGYTFAGYGSSYINSSGQITTWAGASLVYWTNKIWTAQWTQNAATIYNVTLNNKGGSGCSNTTYTAGTGTTIDCVPTKSGYVFGGWCDNSSATTNCATPKVISASATGDKTFYAKWTAAQYDHTVTLNPNFGSAGGTPGTATLYISDGEDIYLDTSLTQDLGIYCSGTNGFDLVKPIRNDNYRFAGYYDSASGGNMYIDEDGCFDQIEYYGLVDGGANETLYAHWEPGGYSCSVTYTKCGENRYLSGGTCLECPANSYKSGMTADTSCTCNTGYTRNGQPSGATTTSGSTGCQPIVTTITLSSTGANNSPTSTIYAKYGDGCYLDSAATSSPLSTSAAATSLTTPTKTGHNFSGYYLGSNTKIINSNKTLTSVGATWCQGLTSNTTLEAQWAPGQYWVDFYQNRNNGTTTTQSGQSIFEGYGLGWYVYDASGTAQITSVTPPTRSDGYTFRGYFTTVQPDLTANGGSGTRLITNTGALPSSSTIISADTLVYEAWARNCNPGTNATCTLTVNNDGTVTYNTSCPSGYTISGNGTYNPTCALSCYAVTLDPNGGTAGSVATLYKKAGDTGWYSDNTCTTVWTSSANVVPTRTGSGNTQWTFRGFFSADLNDVNSDSSTGTLYINKNGASVTAGTNLTVNGPTTIYAAWARSCVQPSGSVGGCALSISDTTGAADYTTSCNSGYTLSGNNTATPTCTANCNMITLDPNNGTAGSITTLYKKTGDAMFYENNTCTTIFTGSNNVVPTRTNYTFRGFYEAASTISSSQSIGAPQPLIDKDGTSTPYGYMAWTVNSDTTIYAGWARNCAADYYDYDTQYSRSVNCTLNIGDSTNNYITTYDTTCKTGYTVLENNNTYNAKCNCVAVSFDTTTNGGSGTQATLYKAYNTTGWYSDDMCSTPITTMTVAAVPKDHSTFGGYYPSASSTSNQRVDTDGTLNTTWTITEPATLYAQYVCDTGYRRDGSRVAGTCMPNEQIITLDDATNGGSGGSGTIYTKYATAAYKDSAHTQEMTSNANGVTIPTKANAVFTGYYSTADTGNTRYIGANGFITSTGITNATSITSNSTWYARFSDCGTCVSGTGVSTCNLSVVNNTCTYTATCSTGYTNPTCNGANCSCTASTNIIILNANGGTGTITVNNTSTTITSSAQTATFTCTTGSSMTLPTWTSGTLSNNETNLQKGSDSPTKKVFLGWSTSSTATTPDTISTCPSDATKTYYAVWGTCTCTPGTNVTSCSQSNVMSNACLFNFTCDAGYQAGAYTSNYCGNGGMFLGSQGVASATTPACSIGTFAMYLLQGTDGYTAITPAVSGDPTTIYEAYGTGWGKYNPDWTAITAAPLPARSGYTFRGYYTEQQTDLTASGGSGTRMIPASGTLPANTTFTCTTDLYAAWARDCSAGTGANCTLTVNNDGSVTYTTSCQAGYYNLQNSGKYNPSCSAITVTTPTDHLTYNRTAQTCPGITVSAPASGNTIKYGTTSGTYTSNTPRTITDAGDTTVYYQVTTSDGNTKTGSYTCYMDKVDCSVNPAWYMMGSSIPDGSTQTWTYPWTDSIVIQTSTGIPAENVTATSSNESVIANSAMTTGNVAGFKTYTLPVSANGTTTISISVAGTSNYNACSASFTLTAQGRTITINKDGGSGTCGGATGTTAGSMTCNYGGTCNAPTWNSSTCNIAKSGKILTGWKDQTNAPIAFGNALFADTTTLTAVWSDCSCTPGTNVTSCTPTSNINNNKCVYNFTCDAGYQAPAGYVANYCGNNGVFQGSQSVASNTTPNDACGIGTFAMNLLQGIDDYTAITPTVSGDPTMIYEAYGTGWGKYAPNWATITTAPIPARSGYTFRGYYDARQTDLTANGGSGTRVINDAGTLPTNTTFTCNTDLYAAWAQNCAAGTGANCTLTVNNDGTVTYNTSCKAGYGTLVGDGTYNPSCTQCSAGTYSADGNNTCTQCPANSFCAAGALEPTACSTLGGGLYNKSAAGSDANTDCYVTTTAGKYVAANTDTAQTTCPVKKYCESVDLYWPNVGNPDNADTVNDGIKSCPVADASTARTTYPDDYYNPTRTSISNQGWTTGITSINGCKANYRFTNARGSLVVDSTDYNSTTGKYDTGGDKYYSAINAGYYGDTRYNATYCNVETRKMLYRDAQPCPAGSYCPGYDAMPLCSSGTYGETIGINSCADNTNNKYASSAALSSAVGQCYLTTTSTKYVASAGAGETSCAAGGYCAGGTVVYYNTDGGAATGGMTVCGTNKYSNAGASTCTACATDNGYGNYGNTVADHAGVASCTVTCMGGEYVATAGAGCVNVGADYWGAGGTVAQNATLERTQCPTVEGKQLTTIGYGTGADEANDCGRILHTGGGTIYMRRDHKTTPSLNVLIGNTTFYGNMSTVEKNMSAGVEKKLKIKKDNMTYYIHDDSADGYTKVEYIQTNGSNYVDTGFAPSGDYTHKIVFNLASVPTAQRYVCGTGADTTRSGNVRVNTSSNIDAIFIGPTGTTAQNILTSASSSTPVPDTTGGNVLIMDLRNNAQAFVYFNGTELATKPSLSTTISGANQAALTLGKSGSTAGTPIKIYGDTIIVNGIAVRDFIPVRRGSDNACGLYDTVNGVFYGSATSTAFTCPNI